jgi:predicted dehydrogenase
MTKRVGMIGISEGNGHPFSFSAIINGYSPEGLKAAGWPVIYEYVRRRHRSEFGIPDLKVTHAWTQDPEVTERLCTACLIEEAVERPEDLLGKIDAVIIARDDWEMHRELAAPFLEAGLPVFVDKPLSLAKEDLEFFQPYLERGRLMSCSGMRFAAELDGPRADLDAYGRLQLIRGAVLNDWARYGIHLLEAISPLLRGRPISVTSHSTGHESVAISLEGGTLVTVDALGESPKTFRVDLFGTERVTHHEISDNFTMFRRMMWEFARMVDTGRPAVPVVETLKVLRLLIGGNIAMKEGRTVSVEDLPF